MKNIKTKVIMLVLGIPFGIIGYTLYYGRGASYLTDNPTACLNCHVMRDAFERWSHSSHKGVTTCNDCHIPKGFIGKWFVKGLNGYNHSKAFLAGNFENAILITDFNKRVVERNCLNCHSQLVSETCNSASGQTLSCVHCHANTGHEK